MTAPDPSPVPSWLGTLEELRIESSFPLDDATRRVCERFAAE